MIERDDRGISFSDNDATALALGVAEPVMLVGGVAELLTGDPTGWLLLAICTASLILKTGQRSEAWRAVRSYWRHRR